VAARHPCGQGYGIAVSTHIRRMALTHPRGPHCISIYDLDVIMSGTNLFSPPVSTHIPLQLVVFGVKLTRFGVWGLGTMGRGRLFLPSPFSSPPLPGVLCMGPSNKAIRL
jgi:hypothetical protein